MKTYSTKSIEANNTINSAFEEIRVKGDNSISKSAFRAIVAVFVVSVIGIVSITSKAGMEFIDTHFSTGYWFVAFILLSIVIALGVKWLVKTWVMLWEMTKEA